MIMYSNKIHFPAKHSAQWQDFVRQALEKKPHLRPTAAAMLEHPWIRCAHSMFSLNAGTPSCRAHPLPPHRNHLPRKCMCTGLDIRMQDWDSFWCASGATLAPFSCRLYICMQRLQGGPRRPLLLA
jgi:serine/threonine protein kinase